jgi:hypothetical protein
MRSLDFRKWTIFRDFSTKMVVHSKHWKMTPFWEVSKFFFSKIVRFLPFSTGVNQNSNQPPPL